jgi:DNA polymerase-1
MNVPDRIDGADLILDTECTGLDIMKDKPLYLAWRLPDRYGFERWSPNLVNWLNDHLPTAKEITWHNGKYDSHMMLQGEVSPAVINYTPIFCTMVGMQLIDEHRFSYALDTLGQELFKLGKVPGVDVTDIKNMRFEDVELYANRDTLITQRLKEYEVEQFKVQQLHQIAEIEMQVIGVLTRMERRGVPIFRDRAEQAKYAMRDAIDQADDDLWQCVGYRTNPNSRPEQKLAFEILGLPVPDSFDKDHLQLVDHPIGQKILDYRQVLVCQNSFVLKLTELIDSITGCIHGNFNQNKGDEGGTRTGRLSMTEPNLQQIPMRVQTIAKVVRYLFGIKGKKWCSGDWSQFEYRIFGHFVGDDNVLEAYRNDPKTDFHQALADITGIVRNSAKRLNLSLVFGAGDGKTAKMLGLPCTEYTENGHTRYKPGLEAQGLFAQYHSRVPKTRPYLRASAQEAEAKGFIRSIYGRKIRFPDRSKAYKAGGLRFQASAADIMKAKLIELDYELMRDSRGAELVLVVHDEFDCLCPDGEEERTCKIMKRVMEDVPMLQLPVLADVSHGSDWWEASS